MASLVHIGGVFCFLFGALPVSSLRDSLTLIILTIYLSNCSGYFVLALGAPALFAEPHGGPEVCNSGTELNPRVVAQCRAQNFSGLFR